MSDRRKSCLVPAGLQEAAAGSRDVITSGQQEGGMEQLQEGRAQQQEEGQQQRQEQDQEQEQKPEHLQQVGGVIIQNIPQVLPLLPHHLSQQL